MTDPRGAASPRPKRRARTPEESENHLIGLAVDLVEKQLEAGTASAQVITHYLKLAGQREKLERLKLENESKLLEARVKAAESNENAERLYEQAIAAMREYGGHSEA